MKQLLTLCALFVFLTGNVQAQQARKTDWKTPLAQDLAQKFDYNLETAKKLVNIKESYFSQIQYYNYPHVQGRMDKQEWAKAVANLREKELKSMNELINDEAKAKETARFLEGKIPTGKGGPRER